MKKPVLYALGLFWLSCFVALALLGRVTAQPLDLMAWYSLAFAAYVVVLICTRKKPSLPLPFILGLALLARLALLASPTSDDLNRYLWEGRMQNEGVNPYALAPADPALQGLAAGDPYHRQINHPEWAAIYPPVTMLWHRAVAFVAYYPLAMKVSFLLAEGLLIWVLMALLSQHGLPRQHILAYAWNPLPLLAIALEGHHEPLYLLGLFAALLFLTHRPLLSVGSWTLGLLAKGFSLVTLPAFFPIWQKKHIWLLPVIAGACYLPFLDAGHKLLGSLLKFGKTLHYNDSLNALACRVAKAMELSDPAAAGRWSMYAVVLCATLWLWIREKQDPMFRCAWMMGTLLLVLPTAHVWYFVAMVPFFCFLPLWGWVALTGSCILTYLVHLEIERTGVWVEWHWIKIPEYAPVFMWLGWCVYKRLTASHHAAPAETKASV